LVGTHREPNTVPSGNGCVPACSMQMIGFVEHPPTRFDPIGLRHQLFRFD
jgi:hypothetical protein